jgi:hypothetical protein
MLAAPVTTRPGRARKTASGTSGNARLVEVDVKSAAGRRGIALPDQLFLLITEHHKQQDHERELAGTEWREGGWMFAQPNGKPIDPRPDQYERKALPAEAAAVTATGDLTMRWLQRISGIIWIFTWRTIYLEIFRWHHMTKSLRFNPPPPPPGTDIRSRPGAPLIAVCVGAVAAPLVFVTAVVVERVCASGGTPSQRTGQPEAIHVT